MYRPMVAQEVTGGPVMTGGVVTGSPVLTGGVVMAGGPSAAYQYTTYSGQVCTVYQIIILYYYNL